MGLRDHLKGADNIQGHPRNVNPGVALFFHAVVGATQFCAIPTDPSASNWGNPEL